MNWHDEYRSKRLYVAEFSCGAVKVGISTQPNQRVIALKWCSPCAVERHPVRWGQTERVTDPFDVERAALAAVGRSAQIQINREWFLGVDFDAAMACCLAVADVSIARYRARQAEKAAASAKRRAHAQKKASLL